MSKNTWTPKQATQEAETLFRRMPLVLGHASQLSNPGDFMTTDVVGLPIVAVRDRDNVLRAFLNVCRHRGTKLVGDLSGKGCKAFVCRYHGWTYELSGNLRHIPQAEAFSGLDWSLRGLVPLPITQRHGLLWIHPQPHGSLDLDTFLGPFNQDLAGLSIDTHRIYRKVTDYKRANWKLVIDAFLEGYHIPHLHPKTLHRFFHNTVAINDYHGPHVRTLSSRTNALEMLQLDRSCWDFRSCSTLLYFFFPNALLLFHPDFISLLRLFPNGPDRCVWNHEMLIPLAGDTEALQEHWQKSYRLIEETVFQKEDLDTAESIQSGLRSGANETFVLGALEWMIPTFHDNIHKYIQRYASDIEAPPSDSQNPTDS